MSRFPPRGPLGQLFPRFTGTIKALRLPGVLPSALRFLRLEVPREHACFAPAAVACTRRRAWGCSLGTPIREFFHGNDRISQVPGEPQFPSAHGLRPRPADASLTVCGTLAWPPMSERRRRRQLCPFRGSIAWLSGSLSTYHGWVTLPRARLASRCWSGSPGRASTRRVPITGFKLTSCSLSSYSKLLGTIRLEISIIWERTRMERTLARGSVLVCHGRRTSIFPTPSIMPPQRAGGHRMER